MMRVLACVWPRVRLRVQPRRHVYGCVYFSLMNALVYVDIDQSIHKGKIHAAIHKAVHADVHSPVNEAVHVPVHASVHAPVHNQLKFEFSPFSNHVILLCMAKRIFSENSPVH